MTENSICVIGAGGIGGAMARRLHATGHDVRVVDPDPAKREAWIADSGCLAAEQLEDVEWRDVTQVIIAVRTEQQVADVLQGCGKHALDDLGVVVVTTVPMGFWSRCASLARPTWRIHEAPVTGGENRARDGSVGMYWSGPDHEPDRRVLASLSNTIVEFGTYGQPALAKLLNNTVAATNAMTAAYAIDVAASRGVAPTVLLEALNVGSGRSMMSELLPQLSRVQYELLEKDVGLLRAEIDSPLGDRVAELSAVVQAALGDLYDPDVSY